MLCMNFLDMYTLRYLLSWKKRKFSRSSTYNLDSPWALLQICYLILFSPFFCLPTIMYVFTVYFHEFFCCNQFTKNVLSFKNFRTLVKLTFTFRIFDDEENWQFIQVLHLKIVYLGIPKIKTNQRASYSKKRKI